MAAANKPKKKAEESSLPSWFNEVMGIGLAGFGVLLMLALVTYTPADVPFYREDGDSTPIKNWVGIIGALLAYATFWIFGAAAYLVAIGAIWLGVAYAVMDAAWTKRKWLGFIAFFVTGSCLVAVLPGVFEEWGRNINLVRNGENYKGGYIGQFLGVKLLKTLLNTVGAVIFLLVAYMIGMILLTGVHPVKFTKALCSIVKEKWTNYRANSKEKKEKDRATREKQAERDRLRAERQAEREAERKAAAVMKKEKKEEPVEPELNLREATKVTLPTPEELKAASQEEAEESAKPAAKEAEKPQEEQATRNTPAPQIIDASQKRNVAALEPGAKPFKKKKSENPSLVVEGYENYETPGFDLLDYDDTPQEENETDKTELIETQETIVNTLKAFGVEVTAGDITRGPTITRYEVYPSLGLRVSRITQLEADLARATKAERINILAPIPGKDTVGIEIANDKKVAVPLRELLQDEGFTSAKKKIPLALGKDVYGNTVIGDLAAMPHLLVAGATGAGKSVCINSIITSILFKFSPDELRFIMVDPKVVEMQVYGDLPHLVVPVVTDPNKVVSALRWVVNEMEKRYRIFAKCGVRNFDGFNNRPRPEKEEEPEEEIVEEVTEAQEEEVDLEHIESIAKAFEDGDLGPSSLSDDDEDELVMEEEIPDRIPYIVVIIDELADLMQTAPADVEGNIARIAQKARAAGIHLIIATQTPRADVVTGIIKANIPSRIAFQVSSALDSRVILDGKGAEKLVGKGDMLYLPPGSAKLERAQGAFVSDEEVEAIVDFCSNQCEQKFEESIQQSIESGGGSSDEDDDDGVSEADEECYQKCLEVIKAEGKASTSLLQRRLRLGYTRAARMMDILEERRIIGPADGAKARDILINVDSV